MNLDKTINQLQDRPIPKPPEYESNLVKGCFDLANKKLKYFSLAPESFRVPSILVKKKTSYNDLAGFFIHDHKP